MQNTSKPLSAPQGQYRFIIVGGESGHLFSTKPFYAKRMQWLGGMVKRYCLQVLVMCLGELMWINVSEFDLSEC